MHITAAAVEVAVQMPSAGRPVPLSQSSCQYLNLKTVMKSRCEKSDSAIQMEITWVRPFPRQHWVQASLNEKGIKDFRVNMRRQKNNSCKAF
jgi:hypothetical protein